MIAQIVLLLWFFLDMTGLYLGDKCLVTRSYKEDGFFSDLFSCNDIVFYKRKDWKMDCYWMDVNMVCNTIYVPRMVQYF